jgi:hypothetical protein
MARTTVAEVKEWTRRNKFLIIMIFVIVGGYMAGQDAAFRDNARDEALTISSR